jgi:hypothetical protein
LFQKIASGASGINSGGEDCHTPKVIVRFSPACTFAGHAEVPLFSLQRSAASEVRFRASVVADFRRAAPASTISKRWVELQRARETRDQETVAQRRGTSLYDRTLRLGASTDGIWQAGD